MKTEAELIKWARNEAIATGEVLTIRLSVAAVREAIEANAVCCAAELARTRKALEDMTRVAEDEREQRSQAKMRDGQIRDALGINRAYPHESVLAAIKNLNDNLVDALSDNARLRQHIAEIPIASPAPTIHIHVQPLGELDDEAALKIKQGIERAMKRVGHLG